MNIVVQRAIFTDKSTIGQMLIDDEFFCYTLEDPDRKLEENPDDKIYGDTAIPRCITEVKIRKWNKKGVDVPWLVSVDGFEWVYIHWGNKPEDTEGCILVGDDYTDDWVSFSRATFNKLMRKIEYALSHGETVTLEVT